MDPCESRSRRAPRGVATRFPTSCLRCYRRPTSADQRPQGRRQKYLLEIAIGQRTAQDLDALGHGQLPIDQYDVTFSDATTTAARPIAFVAQQLFLAYVEAELAGNPHELLDHRILRRRYLPLHGGGS